MEKILLPVDLAQLDKAEALMQEAAKLAQGRDASFTLLYVMSAMPGYMTAELPEDFTEKTRQDCRARLDAFASQHASTVKAETEVRTGSPQHEIIAAAKELKADLIIIASHKPGAADYLLGSVAAAVVRHAPCSVLVHR